MRSAVRLLLFLAFISIVSSLSLLDKRWNAKVAVISRLKSSLQDSNVDVRFATMKPTSWQSKRPRKKANSYNNNESRKKYYSPEKNLQRILTLCKLVNSGRKETLSEVMSVSNLSLQDVSK